MNNRQRHEAHKKAAEQSLFNSISTSIKNNEITKVEEILSRYNYIEHVMRGRSHDNKYDLFEQACIHGRLEIVKLFLNKISPYSSYSLHKDYSNSNTGINGLMLAVQSGNEKLVDYFLTYFDVNKLTHDGNNMLLFAVLGNNIVMFDKMIGLGLNPLQLDKYNKNLMQHMDFTRNDLYPMLDKLISLGLDINNVSKDKKYPTSIFNAAVYYNVDLIEYFIKHHADLSITNQDDKGSHKDLLEFVVYNIYNYAKYNNELLGLILEQPKFKVLRMIDNEFYYNDKKLDLKVIEKSSQYEEVKKFIHFKIMENLTEKPEYKIEKRIKI